MKHIRKMEMNKMLQKTESGYDQEDRKSEKQKNGTSIVFSWGSVPILLFDIEDSFLLLFLSCCFSSLIPSALCTLTFCLTGRNCGGEETKI